MNNVLNRLEKKFGKYAIPNLTLLLIVPQIVLYVFAFRNWGFLEPLFLMAARVLRGEVWRLITFLVLPPFDNTFLVIFYWYLFYLMGTALENHWGIFRYNVYLLIGYIATVAVSFLQPMMPATNAFLQGSVFLAFAFLYPDFVLYIFFILPVKIKWLALLAWLGYGYTLVFGENIDRLMVMASVVNFFLFFAGDIREQIRTGRRRMAFQAQQFAVARRKEEPFHQCLVCGITDISHPDMDFRYCPECNGTCGYCTEHIFHHPHRTEEAPGR